MSYSIGKPTSRGRGLLSYRIYYNGICIADYLFDNCDWYHHLNCYHVKMDCFNGWRDDLDDISHISPHDFLVTDPTNGEMKLSELAKLHLDKKFGILQIISADLSP